MLSESRPPLSITWFYAQGYLVVDHFLWNKNKVPTEDWNSVNKAKYLYQPLTIKIFYGELTFK